MARVTREKHCELIETMRCADGVGVTVERTLDERNASRFVTVTIAGRGSWALGRDSVTRLERALKEVVPSPYLDDATQYGDAVTHDIAPPYRTQKGKAIYEKPAPLNVDRITAALLRACPLPRRR